MSRIPSSGQYCFAMVSALLVALLLTLAPSARAQAQPQVATPQFLFLAQQSTVSGDSGQQITTYTIDTNSGALTPIAAAPAQSRGSIIGGLAINPAGTFLFASSKNSAGEGAVGVFAIAADGSLSEVADSPFAVSDSGALPVVMSASPNGAYVYVASAVYQSFPSPSYTVFDEMSVGSDGSLTVAHTFTITGTTPCDPTFATYQVPGSIYLHPTQKWLYLLLSNPGPDSPSCDPGNQTQTLQYIVGPDGTLTPGQVLVPNDDTDDAAIFFAPSYAMVGSPDGTAIVTEGGPDFDIVSVAAFGVNPVSGELSLTNGVELNPGIAAPPVNPGAAAIDSTGTYIFTTANTVTIADGNLVAAPNPAPGATSPNPFQNGASIFAAPTMPFLFAVTSAGNLLSAQVRTDGSLDSPVSSYGIGATSPYPMITNTATPIPTAPVLWLKPATATTFAITDVAVGQTGTGTVTITNQGYGSLSISEVSIAGDPSLSQTNTCTAPLAPAATCTATVKFAPTSAGTFTGSLTVESNVPTQTLPISATSQGGQPDLVVVAPNPILFPDTQTGTSSPLTFTIQNASSATAPLVISGFTIAGSNPGDFSETDSCTSAPIPVGSACSITITFTPQATGNRAASLSATSNATSSGPIAEFVGNGVASVTDFSLTTTVVGDGTLIQSPSGISLPNNTIVTLNAYPGASAKFTNWSGNACNGSTVTTCTFTLTANTSITATFTLPLYSFTTIATGPGTITQSPAGTSFSAGTGITLTAVPNSGATFTAWGGTACAGITSTTCSFQMPSANTSVTATFAASTYTLTTTAAGPGTISQSPAGNSFASGTSITLTAVPTTGDTFTSWSGGECAASTSATCTFSMPAANTSVTATFAAAPAVVVPDPSQTGSAGGSFTFAINTSGFTTTPTLTASCTIPAGSCAINGTNLVVTTTARTSSATHPLASFVAPPASRGSTPSQAPIELRALATLFALAMCAALARWFSSRRAPQAWRPRMAFASLSAIAMFAALALLAACGGGGGGGGSTGTPAATYTVKVTATAGTQTATTNVTVTVQ